MNLSLIPHLLHQATTNRHGREGSAEASRARALRARVDDLVAGLLSPGDNERLIFLKQLLKSERGMLWSSNLRRDISTVGRRPSHAFSGDLSEDQAAFKPDRDS